MLFTVVAFNILIAFSHVFFFRETDDQTQKSGRTGTLDFSVAGVPVEHRWCLQQSPASFRPWTHSIVTSVGIVNRHRRRRVHLIRRWVPHDRFLSFRRLFGCDQPRRAQRSRLLGDHVCVRQVPEDLVCAREINDQCPYTVVVKGQTVIAAPTDVHFCNRGNVERFQERILHQELASIRQNRVQTVRGGLERRVCLQEITSLPGAMSEIHIPLILRRP